MQTRRVTEEISLKSVPLQSILTVKHIIIIFEDNNMEWYIRYDESIEYDEELKMFGLEKTYKYPKMKITQAFYNHDLTNIIIGTENAEIDFLRLPAENFQDEEEEEEGDKVKKKKDKKIRIEPEYKGRGSSGSIKFIGECARKGLLLTATSSGELIVWNLAERYNVKEYHFEGKFSCGQLSKNHMILGLGSKDGVIRILDISDPMNVKIQSIFKFKEKPVSKILISHTHIIAIYEKSKKLLFFSDDYYFVGSVKMPFEVLTICLNSLKDNTLVVVHHFFLLLMNFPENASNRERKFDYQTLTNYGRRIDPELYHCQQAKDGNLYMTGDDKLLKVFKIPDEHISKIDMKLKVPGNPPIDEVYGHPLQTKSICLSEDGTKCVTGGTDGSILLRNLRDLSNPSTVKSQNLESGGVSYILFSSNPNLIYAGGFDGSLILWKTNDFEIENPLIDPEERIITDVEGDYSDEHIQLQKIILEDEYNRSQEEVREKSKREMILELKEIKKKLNSLLSQNSMVDEIEKLDREEFAINLERKENILKECEKEKKKIQREAKREILKEEIIHKKIKKEAWDTMETHLKAINGIKSNMIVFNYQIREVTPSEIELLKKIIHYRKIEIREKKFQEELKIDQLVDINQLCSNPNEFIINPNPGIQKLILNDYEKKEDLSNKPSTKDHQGLTASGRLGLGNRGVGIKRVKEKEEIQKEDEKAIDNLKEGDNKKADDPGEWQYLYGAFELFTDVRRRNQSILIQHIIYKIKKEFNKEFESMLVQKMNQVDKLKEKSKRIQEILIDLERDSKIVEPNPNFLDQPDEILKVSPSEIPFEKFFSKEERDRREAERIREEEKKKALMSDDSSLRA